MAPILILTRVGAALCLLVWAPDGLPIKYKRITDMYGSITDVNTDFGTVQI